MWFNKEFGPTVQCHSLIQRPFTIYFFFYEKVDTHQSYLPMLLSKNLETFMEVLAN